jgi:MoxR-like ATPase
MSRYPFQIVNYHGKVLEDVSVLAERPFTQFNRTFANDARYFVPGEQLETAINTAVAVGEPLLITGEPGTGKTQAAYYAAYKLNIEPVLHFQVKSDSSAQDLLYFFDTVRYFHDAHLSKAGDTLPDKSKYVEHRAMWEAFDSKTPRVLLIDEIDKAPRDFPNDLLHELDKMEFKVSETGQTVSASAANRPVVFITSNSERRLPEPFLRRCVYHHIRFDDDIVNSAVEGRRHEYAKLSQDFLKMAVARFKALRDRNLRKPPSTGELLVWLRVLAMTTNGDPKALDADLSKLPHLNVLLKDHKDAGDLAGQR